MLDLTRIIATGLIAAAFSVILIVLISTASTFGGMSFGHFVLAFFLATFMFASFGVVWNWGDSGGASSKEEEAKKRKNGDKLSRILSKLSDEDLELLRERLNDDTTGYGLGEDGEFVARR